MGRPEINGKLYISSGRKNAMYTLRIREERTRRHPSRFWDHYICNLSTDKKEAEAKALAFWFEFYMDTNVQFDAEANFDLNEWGQNVDRFSRRERRCLDAISNDIMPFGKHAGCEIATLDDGYVMWWAKKEGEMDTVTAALHHRMQGIATDRGLWQKFVEQEEKRQEEERHRVEKRANSVWVGEIKKRMELNVTVTGKKYIDTFYGGCTLVFMEDENGNSLRWFASNGGIDKGDCRIRATVKKHDEYRDEKQTILTRVSVVERFDDVEA